MLCFCDYRAVFSVNWDSNDPSYRSRPSRPRRDRSNFLSDPVNLKAMITSVEFCRELANSAAIRPFVKREVMPGGMKGKALENFV